MLCSVLLLSSMLVAQAEAPSPEQLKSTVRKLARQLDDDELATRDQAEQALIKLGPDALDHIPRITSRTPAEVKERLGRVIKAIESEAAKQAARGSRINLSGELSLQEALDALEKQSGNKVVGVDNREAKINITVKDAPYWEALDQILDQATLTVDPYGGSRGKLQVMARPEQEVARYGGANYSGPFRFEATRIEAVRDLRNPELQGLQIQIDISWEPRSTPILLTQPLDQLEATDEDGNTLDIAQSQGSRVAPIEGDISVVPIQIPFALPNRDVKRIASLKGTLTAMVPGRVETFEFEDLPQLDNEEQQRAGVTVVVEKLRKNNELFALYMRVKFDEANNALESHRGWIYNNEAFLINAKGQRVENAGLETTRQEINEVGLAYLFAIDDDPKNYKFVYRTPALIVRLPVKYDIREIELP